MNEIFEKAESNNGKTRSAGLNKLKTVFKIWVLKSKVIMLQLIRSSLTLQKGCEDVINYDYTQYCEWL